MGDAIIERKGKDDYTVAYDGGCPCEFKRVGVIPDLMNYSSHLQIRNEELNLTLKGEFRRGEEVPLKKIARMHNQRHRLMQGLGEVKGEAVRLLARLDKKAGT